MTSEDVVSLNAIDQLLKRVPELKASDLHVSAGMPLLFRINGDLRPTKTPPLTPEQTSQLILGILTAEQRTAFEKNWDLDFCYNLEGVGRFRANVLKQRKGTNAVFRFIPPQLPSPKSLGLTDAIIALTGLHQGLVLVTGPTRSGKTTTLASLIQTVNEREAGHIITVEDPIEFTFPKGKSLINQREVQSHTKSTASALRAALREDPDIIMVGEMRDLETIQLAISAAETGHLVFSTLQTQSAHKTIDRIVDSFPANQAPQIRAMLSESLRGVISQQLLKRADGNGMVLALEVLLSTTSLANLIRDGKTFQIPSVIQTGAAVGMRKMDDSIGELLRDRIITNEEAMRRAHNRKDVEMVLERKKKHA